MKTILVLCGFLVAFAASAQTTNAPTANAEPSAQTQISGTRTQATIELKLAKPNEIVKGNFRMSGILVAAVKSRNPPQLLNPLASPQYGGPADNIVKDPTSGKVAGLKVFALQF